MTKTVLCRLYFPKGVSQEANHKAIRLQQGGIGSPHRRRRMLLYLASIHPQRFCKRWRRNVCILFAVSLSLPNFSTSYNHHVPAGEVGTEFAKVGTTCSVNVLTPSGLNPKSLFFSPSEFPRVFFSVCPAGLDTA